MMDRNDYVTAQTNVNIVTVLILALNYMLGWIFPPVARNANQLGNSKLPNDLPDIQTLADLRASGLLDDEQYNANAVMQGFNIDWAARLAASATAKLSPDMLIGLYRRGYITKDQLTDNLVFLKYPKRDIDSLLTATEFFPSVSDLITFAVREVYSPDIAEKFGQFEDLPQDFINEGAKAGLSEDQARNYWAAHWQLPSLSQGYEMFQRRIISHDELVLLLKAQDVMPFWRDKLIQAAYNPLTRVDVRRMYGLGVLTEQDVYNSFLDTGYSPDNAHKMTAFTLRYESNEYDGITRGNVIQAFVDDLITEVELKEYLKGLNYTDKTIDFWTEQANFTKELAIIKEVASDLETMYQQGTIDMNGIRSELSNLGVPTQYVEGIINKLIRKKSGRTKAPDKLDLISWYNNGAIDDKTFTMFMRGLGYTNISIQAYMTNSILSGSTGKRKYLPVKTYQGWYTQKIMTEDDFKSVLAEQGYSDFDIQTLIKEGKPNV
jgi:hypothetical protein